MFDEVLEDEGRVSEKHKERLREVSLTKIDLGLKNHKSAGLEPLSLGRSAYLMMNGLGGARPVFEAHTRVPVEFFCSLAQFLCAHGLVAHARVNAVHLKTVNRQEIKMRAGSCDATKTDSAADSRTMVQVSFVIMLGSEKKHGCLELQINVVRMQNGKSS